MPDTETTETTETLEQQFQRIQQEQAAQIAQLQQQITERDNLIRKYMTVPSTEGTPKADESDDAFSSADVADVLAIIKRKRS